MAWFRRRRTANFVQGDVSGQLVQAGAVFKRVVSSVSGVGAVAVRTKPRGNRAGRGHRSNPRTPRYVFGIYEKSIAAVQYVRRSLYPAPRKEGQPVT
jgi:hypothetical protein